jgi:hypothetical protein
MPGFGILRGCIMFRFDRVLAGPSREELLDVLLEASASADQDERVNRVLLDQVNPGRFLDRWENERVGIQQWNGGRPTDSAAPRSVVAIAWWTDRIGRKHCRIVGERAALGEGEIRNLFSPQDDDRPDLWLVYPDRACFQRDWLQRHLWVTCPCGVAGPPEAVGWMGPCCGACHDRREEGTEENRKARPLCLASRTPFTEVAALAFSLNGRDLASVGQGKGVWLWDLPTGRERQLGSQANCQALHFLRRGLHLLLSNPEGHWLTTLEHRRAHRLAETGAFVALPSFDGKVVALVCADHVDLIDPHSQGNSFGTLRGHVRPIRCAALSRNGRLLATGSEDRTVIVWDLRLLQERSTYQGFRGPLSALAFSPDGRRLAVGFGEREKFSCRKKESREIVLWDVGTSKLLPLDDLSESIWDFRFSPDGRTLALAAGDAPMRGAPARPGSLLLYDTRTGTRQATLEWHDSTVLSLAFSADGEWLATGGADGHLRLWPWQSLRQG